MKKRVKNSGSVLLITVFVIALLSALAIGMLQINAEEIQLVQNHVYAAEAQAIAEAGLNDAFAQLRTDSGWNSGFKNKPFPGGSYTVNVSGSLPNLTLESTAVVGVGFAARVGADIIVGTEKPYSIAINNLRINE